MNTVLMLALLVDGGSAAEATQVGTPRDAESPRLAAAEAIRERWEYAHLEGVFLADDPEVELLRKHSDRPLYKVIVRPVWADGRAEPPPKVAYCSVGSRRSSSDWDFEADWEIEESEQKAVSGECAFVTTMPDFTIKWFSDVDGRTTILPRRSLTEPVTVVDYPLKRASR